MQTKKILLLSATGLIVLIVALNMLLPGNSQTKNGNSSKDAKAKRHLFESMKLHEYRDGAMRPTERLVEEGTFSVLDAKDNVGGYDWIRITDARRTFDGYVYEHLTSAIPAEIEAGESISIGQERVDRWNALPYDYRPRDLVTLDAKYCRIRNIEMRNEAAEALQRLAVAARDKGLAIYGFSGYRSYETQRKLYLARIAHGEKHRQKYVARPGHTEHQLGTVVDVVNNDIANAAQLSFDNTAEAKWLRTNCYDFGFVLSYGSDNTESTGYGFESWHLRYIGKSNIAEWVENHLSADHPVRKKS